tara:strand:+ start:1562 stop:1732 length:171 start_codon:yes stop_codon:yes gene_type:complete
MSEKDAGMRIRVERELREEFIKACRERDVPAAQVLRGFMRDFVRQQHQEQESQERD